MGLPKGRGAQKTNVSTPKTTWQYVPKSLQDAFLRLYLKKTRNKLSFMLHYGVGLGSRMKAEN